MGVSFTAPDGKDPVEYAQKVFHDITMIPERRLQKLGDEMALRIKQRTADGISFTGEAFASYNAKYAKWKESSDVDLYGVHDDEHMMDELRVQVTSTPPIISIGFPDGSPKAALARIHNEGSHATVSSHSRGGKLIPAYQRRKKIRGFTPKGGRAVHGQIFQGFKKETYTKKLKPLKVRVWKSERRTLKMGFRGKSLASVVDRIAVRSKKIRVFIPRSETHTRRVPQFARGVLYRNPSKAVIPARPFLGLTAEDIAFTERNILPPPPKG